MFLLMFYSLISGMFNPVSAGAFTKTGPLFRHINQVQNQSLANINCLLQDSRGFIWFGTNNGLLRYDGYALKTYLHQDGVPHSLSNNVVMDLIEDNNGLLWIATYGGGLNRFDPSTGLFTNFIHHPQKSNSLSNNNLWELSLSENNQLWIGSRNWIDLFDIKSHKNTRLSPKSTPPLDIANNNIWSILHDSRGRTWVGTLGGGVYLYDRDNKLISNLKFIKNAENTLSNDLVRTMLEDTQGNIWVGTDDGLNRINPDDLSIKTFFHHPDDNTSLSSNVINALYQDNNQTIWVGTYGKGLNRYQQDSETFYQMPGSNKNNNRYNFSASIVNNIMQDNQGVMWFATEKGIYQLNPLAMKFNYWTGKNFSALLQRKNGKVWVVADSTLYQSTDIHQYERIKKDIGEVTVMVEDDIGDVWLGTKRQGLWHYSQQNHQFTKHSVLLPGNSVSALYYQQGVLWIGLVMDGQQGGLVKYSLTDRKITRFNPELNVMNIHSLSPNRLLISTNAHGPWLFNTLTSQSHSLKSKLVQNQWNIVSTYVDSENIAWLGTESGGLVRYDSVSDTIHSLTTNEGLLSNSIRGITGDSQYYLWLISSKGLMRLTKSDYQIQVFNSNNGLRPITYNNDTVLTLTNGNILLGGYETLMSYQPAALEISATALKVPTQVRLTDFKLLNKSVEFSTVEHPTPLSEPIDMIKFIELSHHQYLFSFTFSALDFSAPMNNHYAYMMQGLDDDWIETDANNRVATYTTLPPGNYRFKVKATNSSQHWTDVYTVDVSMLPPFWLTWQALSFYILTVITLIYGVILLRTKNLQQRSAALEQGILLKTEELLKKNQQLEVKTRTIESLLAQEKQMFANISHEFKTPLTLIINPLKTLLSRARSDSQIEKLTMIKRNSFRLLRMVNQMLSLASAGSKQTLIYKEIAIGPLVNEIIGTFKAAAAQRKLSIVLDCSNNQSAKLVADSLETIVINLLSNAIKYADESTTIKMLIRGSVTDIELSVINHGLVIEKHHQTQIFEHFHRGNVNNSNIQGNGIGLALVKQLVTLNQGTINLTSSAEGLTCFTVHLPILVENIEAQASLTTSSFDMAHSIKLESDILQLQQPELLVETDDEEDSSKPLILVIEDNPEMQVLIKHCLAEKYHCVAAMDGEAGIEMALNKLPKLIVCDIMMPKMDGYQVSEQLRSNITTSHIPIVILTAKGDITSRMIGWKKNVDDYLTKPFDADELALRVDNLLEIRRLITSAVGQQVSKSNPIEYLRSIEVTTSDQVFVGKFEAVIAKNYHDPTFNRSLAADSMAMSVRQLNRKLDALFDFNFTEYLKRYRLRQSLALLAENKQIAIISECVGFASPSYFSSCFKGVFGQSVKQYQIQLRQDLHGVKADVDLNTLGSV